jgi:hypothetical protein
VRRFEQLAFVIAGAECAATPASGGIDAESSRERLLLGGVDKELANGLQARLEHFRF